VRVVEAYANAYPGCNQRVTIVNVRCYSWLHCIAANSSEPRERLVDRHERGEHPVQFPPDKVDASRRCGVLITERANR
jgi:hypothetical protein